MRRTSSGWMPRAIAATIMVLIAGGGALALKAAIDAQRPKGTDEDQIQQMLVEAPAAAMRRDAGTVCKYVSSNYQDSNGFNDARLKYEIHSYLGRHGGIQVDIPHDSIQVAIAPDGRTGNVKFEMNVSAE